MSYSTKKAQQLTMKDALLINCNVYENLQQVDPHMLPYVTLNKIMTCEYENGLCCYFKSSGTSWDDSDSEDDDGDKMGYHTKDDKKDTCTIHPVDNLLTQIHCSDNILRQNIMSKLSLCQVAIPLLLPNHLDGTVTLLLWAMRCTIKKWDIEPPKDNKTYMESPITDCLSPVISFLRVGSIHLSKSEIFNRVIGEFDFFSRDATE